MRPKETYTLEEYNTLKQEINNLKKQLLMTEKQLENIKFINTILTQYERDKSYENIQCIIAEEVEKRRIKEKWGRYPYYIKIREYVDFGITDINQIAQLIGKSYSSVWRALKDMGMYPLNANSISNIKLNI